MSDDERRKLELPLNSGGLVVWLIGLLLGIGGGGAGGTWAASSALGSDLRVLVARVDQLATQVGELGKGSTGRLDRLDAEMRTRAEQAARVEARLDQAERRLAALEGKR